MDFSFATLQTAEKFVIRLPLKNAECQFIWIRCFFCSANVQCPRFGGSNSFANSCCTFEGNHESEYDRLSPAQAQQSVVLFDVKKLAMSARPSVALVTVFDKSGKLLKFGTGFFVSSDGKKTTNGSR